MQASALARLSGRRARWVLGLVMTSFGGCTRNSPNFWLCCCCGQKRTTVFRWSTLRRRVSNAIIIWSTTSSATRSCRTYELSSMRAGWRCWSDRSTHSQCTRSESSVDQFCNPFSVHFISGDVAHKTHRWYNEIDRNTENTIKTGNRSHHSVDTVLSLNDTRNQTHALIKSSGSVAQNSIKIG